MSQNTVSAPRGEYALGADSDLGLQQLKYLETLLDRHSVGILESTGVGPGWRCLDIGPGTGSIAGWLSETAGSVTAADVNTQLVVERPGVRVLQHDINDGAPDGPYDLIHARLVLMHLSRRKEILGSLAQSLSPGGWLVIGEYIGPQGRVLSSPSAEDAALFDRVQQVAHHVVARGLGVSYEWARQVDGLMVQSGLTEVETVEHQPTAAGGSLGCLLSLNYVQQLTDHLVGAGFTVEELRRYAELMHDPRFRAWFYPFVSTRGRRPAD